MQLPEFRYHPDPVKSGVVIDRAVVCDCCGENRSHIYDGPMYHRGSERPVICPWCVADGSAAAKYSAEFVDGHDIAHLKPEIITEVTTRTPSYVGWQQETWLSHCDDAAMFLERLGTKELELLPESASGAVRDALRDWGRTDVDREKMFSFLHRDGDLTAYLFQCLHCDAYVATVDAS